MKILIVEDEISVANLIMRGLKQEGHLVEHIPDGKEGLYKILDNRYDAVVLDLLLPAVNGEDILKEIRRKKNTTPIIVLTAVTDTETKIRLLNMGADDFLEKPFSFLELATRIKSVVRRSQGEKPKIDKLQVRDLTLIPSKRLVMRGENKINLRLKEFDLLEYFMLHTDKIISRNTLVEKVWDYNAQIFSNTVDSHISLLRKKVNQGGDKELIETIHGIGYVMRSE